MPWFCGDYLTLDLCPNQGKITNDIQQFMPCRFICPVEIQIIENTIGLYGYGILIKSFAQLLRRRVKPRPASAEPNSQTAAGIGITVGS